VFRVPVPHYERRPFRESLVNAVVHHDYTRLGAVHVRWETDALAISNPGGFVEGVRRDSESRLSRLIETPCLIHFPAMD
jgi:ATP-dependent DNA helicase RecG